MTDEQKNEIAFEAFKMLDEQKKDIVLKTLKVLEFVKEAFCIDGSITLMPITKYSFNGTCMKLTDSKRGTFYIAMIQEDKLQVE